MKTALTIAGSDSSGGAGIQADLKTFIANGVYGMSVITSVTSQNTTGVFGVYDIPAEAVASQLDAVFTDIYPDSVKIGMVSSAEIVDVIAEKLRRYGAKNIVLDTVMVSTSGCPLITEDAKSALIEKLFPLADIITPNIPEARVLSGIDITDEGSMLAAAEKIGSEYNVRVLLKSGHLSDSAEDILYDNGNIYRYVCERVNNPNTHGTGCTLSSAIAANLAHGMNFDEAIRSAKRYITGALLDGMNLGHGSGPLNHGYDIAKMPR